jgi:hypothetical protein
LEEGFEAIKATLEREANSTVESLQQEADRLLGVDVTAIERFADDRIGEARRMVDFKIRVLNGVHLRIAGDDVLREAVIQRASFGSWATKDQFVEMIATELFRFVASETAREELNKLDPAVVGRVEALWQEFQTTFQNELATLSDAQRHEVIATLRGAGAATGLSLAGVDVKISDWWREKVEQPVLDGTWGEHLSGTIVALFDDAAQFVVGLGSDFVTSLSDFADRMTRVGEMMKEGNVGHAMKRLFEGVGLLVRDVAVDVVSNAVALVFNALGDIEGALLGRPLSQRERDFAHEIFGNDVNLTNIKVVESSQLTNNRGAFKGNTIFIPGSDAMSRDEIATFAHELLHVWQEQNGYPLGRAYRDQLDNIVNGAQPYKLEIHGSTSWRDLGREQQGQLVENYLEHLEGIHTLSATELANYQRILGNGPHLFTGYLNAAGVRSWSRWT